MTLCSALFACARYAPKQLPAQARWSDTADLRVDARRIALPSLGMLMSMVAIVDVDQSNSIENGVSLHNMSDLWQFAG
ncbi:MAG TPA: hypothetical protein VEV20_07940 [Burkholderiales bacterium]|nr:hypothetical protein [Burkholderiales bacterium]